MVERSSRLDLIERAAKRLGTVESTVAALPPVREDGLAADLDPVPPAEIPALSLPLIGDQRPEPAAASTLAVEDIAKIAKPSEARPAPLDTRATPGQRTC